MADPSNKIPIADYQQALAESVHFSTKTINSNIDKGGIRLSNQQALDLPYISARTLLADNLCIATDYQANAGKTASLFKVIKSAMTDEPIIDAKGEAENELQAVANDLTPAIEALFEKSYQSGLDHINIRMRQLLLPQDDDYISISPITAAGVNYWLNKAVDTIKEQRKTNDNHQATHFNNITTAVFGIGGANPQNVGSLVRAMQRPIYLTTPTANDEIRQAFRLFYQGFDYYIPHKIQGDNKTLSALIYWAELIETGTQQTAQDTHQDWQTHGIFATKTNLESRSNELTYLTQIVRIVLAQGKKARQTLEQVKDKLPQIATELDDNNQPVKQLSPLLHPSVPLVIQGLIDPNLRDEGWVQVFSIDLARQIVRQSYQKPNQNKSQQQGKNDLTDFVIDDSAQGFLARRIRDVLYADLSSKRELA